MNITVFERFIPVNPSLYGGYRLTGIVTINGVPGRRRVFLFEYPTMRLMANTWSDAQTGRYTFSNVKQRPCGGSTWGVIAVDHTGEFDPEAKVGLQAELL